MIIIYVNIWKIAIEAVIGAFGSEKLLQDSLETSR